jgi:phosphatidylserine decarboxylase
MSRYPHPIIAVEGIPFVMVLLLASVLVGIFFGWWSLPLWIATIFVLQFFRDPPRVMPEGQGLVLCPADGRVIVVGEAPDPHRGGTRSLKVSIFMNVFNVHSQRAPVAGVIKKVLYSRGLFVNAAFDKASSDNERNALVIRMDDGREISCVQVAGLIAPAHPLLRERGRAPRPPASATASSASARGSTCICRPRHAEGRDRRQGEGDLHGAGRALARTRDAKPCPRQRGPRTSARPIEPQQRRRGIYLLPNAFTTLNLFAGFYAIVQGMNHEYEKAAVAIFVAPGARQPRRPRRAPHAHAVGLRRGVRQPGRHGVLRSRAGA